MFVFNYTLAHGKCYTLKKEPYQISFDGSDHN